MTAWSDHLQLPACAEGRALWGELTAGDSLPPPTQAGPKESGGWIFVWDAGGQHLEIESPREDGEPGAEWFYFDRTVPAVGVCGDGSVEQAGEAAARLLASMDLECAA